MKPSNFYKMLAGAAILFVPGAAAAQAPSTLSMGIVFKNTYIVECHMPDGKLRWSERNDNIVVNDGLNDYLNKYFKGAAYTAAFYVGVAGGTPVFAAADTLASHGGWAEVTAYSEAVRQTLTLGSVASQTVNNSASKAVFTINVNDTVIGGTFLATNSTKGGTTGVLYGGAAFGSGNRTAQSGDTLTVTVVLNASSG